MCVILRICLEHAFGILSVNRWAWRTKIVEAGWIKLRLSVRTIRLELYIQLKGFWPQIRLQDVFGDKRAVDLSQSFWQERITEQPRGFPPRLPVERLVYGTWSCVSLTLQTDLTRPDDPRRSCVRRGLSYGWRAAGQTEDYGSRVLSDHFMVCAPADIVNLRWWIS